MGFYSIELLNVSSSDSPKMIENFTLQYAGCVCAEHSDNKILGKRSRTNTRGEEWSGKKISCVQPRGKKCQEGCGVMWGVGSNVAKHH